MRQFAYSSKLFNSIKVQKLRDRWVKEQLAALPSGSSILDAGCGSQRYRQDCRHLNYKAQDFGEYITDDITGFDESIGDCAGYEYGKLDYKGDICKIDEVDNTFDAILCTEVLEHIPFPVAAMDEMMRLLKPGGKLILTAPTYSLKHMDPYHFYTGFTNRFYERYALDNELELIILQPCMTYFKVMAMELARIMSKINFIFWPLMVPAFFFLYLKRTDSEMEHVLPYGYHVVIRK